MGRPGFTNTPYFTPDEFVSDVAALAVVYPDTMRRRVKKSTVLSSLALATYPVQLQYLFNGPIYVAHSSRPAALACIFLGVVA
jgi:hypothetical protein